MAKSTPSGKKTTTSAQKGTPNITGNPTGGAKPKAAAPKKAGPAAMQGARQAVATPEGAALEPVILLSHDEIARRAYEIWLAKGCPADQDAQNWTEAESQLRAERAQR